MYVVVVQRFQENLDAIRLRMEERCAPSVVIMRYVRTAHAAHAVLCKVPADEPVVVITGSVLHEGEDTFDGVRLARSVKQKYPWARCFNYSVLPCRDTAFDGIIPKEAGTISTGDHVALLRFLAALPDITAAFRAI